LAHLALSNLVKPFGGTKLVPKMVRVLTVQTLVRMGAACEIPFQVLS